MAGNGEGKSYYGLGLDNSQLRTDAKQSSSILKNIGDSAVAEGSRIDNVYKKIAGFGTSLLILRHAKAFINQIVKVRGEIESLSISFETLLGSKQKADALFGQIKEFAAKTPLELTPLAKGAQTLLSFNVEAEKVMPILKQIGDISMGSSDKFNSLVLAFSQMHSTGKLMGQDLLQMINAEFNPLTIIAEKTGKSIGALKEEMSNGAISADMVADAFASAAGEGGKFYGMLDKQSRGIEGSISNLQGAIDDMLNDLGTKGQGVITSSIAGATSIVENYEKIGKTIMDIVVAYGLYKAALITLNAIQNLNRKILMQAVLEKRLAAAAGIQLSNAESAAAARTKLLSLAQNGLVKALNAAKVAMLSNPYMLIAAAVATLAFGIYKLVTAESAAEVAQRRHNEAVEAAKEKKENLMSKIQQLTNNINDETKTIYSQIKAWKELQKEMPEAFGNMTISEFKNMKPEERDKLIDKTTNDSEIASQNAELERYASLLDKVNEAKKRGDYASQGVIAGYVREAMGMKGFFNEIKYGTDSVITALEETVGTLKKQKAQRDENIRQAEFESKPDSEKLNILNEQLQKYKDQYAEIEKLVSESEKVADLMNKDVTSSISDVEKGLFGVNTEWGKFDFQTYQNIAQLEFFKGKINETGDAMAAIIDANGKGMSYAEAKKKAKEEYENAKKLLAEITKNGSRYSQEDYTKAVEDLDTKKKSYEALGGTTKQEKVKKYYTTQIEQEERELIHAYTDLEFAVEQARINSMNEGVEKVLAQNKLNHEQELEQLKRQREDILKQLQDNEKTKWKDKHPKLDESKFKTTITKLPDEYNKIFDKLTEESASKRKKQEDDLLDDLLDKYGDYEQKRSLITKKYEQEINLERKKGNETLAKKIEGERDIELMSLTDDYINFYEHILGLSEEAAKNIHDVIKEQLQTLLDEGKITLERYLRETEKLKEKHNENKQFHKAGNTINNNSSSSILDMIDNMKASGEFLSRKGTEMLKAGNEEGFKFQQMGEKMQGSAVKLQGAFAVVDKIITQIHQSIQASHQMVESIAELREAFGKDDSNSAFGDFTEYSKMLADFDNKVYSGFEKFKNGDIAGAIADNVTATVNLITSIAKLGDSKKEKKIQELQKEYDELEYRISRLDKKIDELKRLEDKEYGKDKSDVIAKENEVLNQQIKDSQTQIEIIKKQIAEEKDKKDPDSDRIKEYERQIDTLLDQQEEYRNQIEDNKQAAIDAINGTDIKTAIDDFAQAYVDAWAAGEDKASSMKEVVRKMIKAAVTELVKSRMKDEVQAFMDYLAAAMEDGILTVAEKNTLDALEAKIENKLNNLDKSFDKYMIDDTSRDASSKGFASMSQDSADELNGRFTAIQANTYAIIESMKILIANSGRILQHLAGIENNTESCKRLDGMDADLRAIKDSLHTIELKGITIKK
jgi:tape measure domain-containing protein